MAWRRGGCRMRHRRLVELRGRQWRRRGWRHTFAKPAQQPMHRHPAQTHAHRLVRHQHQQHLVPARHHGHELVGVLGGHLHFAHEFLRGGVGPRQRAFELADELALEHVGAQHRHQVDRGRVDQRSLLILRGDREPGAHVDDDAPQRTVHLGENLRAGVLHVHVVLLPRQPRPRRSRKPWATALGGVSRMARSCNFPAHPVKTPGVADFGPPKRATI